MTPVTVVTGFLGAGKTTLINRWLTELGEDAAVIVNELGEVGIDGQLLRARTLVEIAGGCICCSTQAELVRALDELAGAKRIVIETSGAASPSGVLHAIAGGERRGTHVLDGIVTVVDASRFDALLEHDLAIEQIGYADVIVLSRTEVAPPRLAELNGAAVVSPARPLEVLLSARTSDFVSPPRAAATPHVYESISLYAEGEVDGDRFADFMETELGSFAGRIFRTKGVLAVQGMNERMIVQGVTDLVEVTFGEPWASTPRTCRLVVVGFGLDRAALERAFEATLT